MAVEGDEKRPNTRLVRSSVDVIASVAPRRERGRDTMNTPTYDFNDQVALITGAASRLGLAPTKAFAEAGAAVVLADVDEIALHELRQMRQQGSGAIVNCSSLGGLVGLPSRAAYHASKHGVIGLTKSAALEYAPRGIRINAVCPGTIDTPMVADMLEKQADAMKEIMRDQPIGRLGRSDEIAAAVFWLCSPGASFVLGVALPVDGGFTAH